MEYKNDLKEELKHAEEFNDLLMPLSEKINEIKEIEGINHKFIVSTVQYLLTDIWGGLEELKNQPKK